MATNAFKIFDEKNFAKGAVRFLNDFRLSSYENDHLMDIREVSDCFYRTFCLSGMKKHVSSIIPNGFSQVEGYIQKSNFSTSVFCGGQSVTNLHVIVHSDK
jgi:hypothetical protein